MKKIMTSSILAVAMLTQAFLSQTAFAEKIVGDAKKASSKVSMCIGCHAITGYKTAFPFVYHVPMLGGQNQAYIEKALKAYQSGERKHPSMQAIAKSLSDQDIANLAAYYAAQTAATPNNKTR